MKFDLTGKKALVTGSTQGIGYAIAQTLVEHGAQVFVHCSVNQEKADNVAKKIGAVAGVTADLSNLEQTLALFDKTGPVDILVLNASVQIPTKWNEITPEDFDKQVNVNLKSTLMLMQKYYPAMRDKKWGRIVTIGSVQQTKPHVNMAVYAATKSAVMNLVTNVAAQVAHEGITVNNMAPGVIATPRNDAALSDDKYLPIVLAKIPAKFPGEASDCAGAVLLLCSDEGRYITGTDIVVDGGMHL